MPNWKTHFEVAKKMNKFFKYEGINFEKFMLGNILPDINNGYLVENVSKRIEKDYTHYKDVKNKVNYEYFYNRYKNEIKNDPMFVGYLAHLLTDYFFDEDFKSRIKNFDEDFKNRVKNLSEYSKQELVTLKQSEFAYYNNLYKDNILKFKYIDEIILETKKINRVSIQREDIFNVMEFLKKKNNIDYNTVIYTEIIFEELVQKTSNNIIEYIVLKTTQPII
jgi:hypothetical protein